MKTDLEQLKDFILNTQTMAEQGECLMLNVTDVLNEIERLQALTIPDVMQSCDTCKHLSTCRFWQEAPNNGATCKFYIEHVA